MHTDVQLETTATPHGSASEDTAHASPTANVKQAVLPCSSNKATTATVVAKRKRALSSSASASNAKRPRTASSERPSYSHSDVNSDSGREADAQEEADVLAQDAVENTTGPRVEEPSITTTTPNARFPKPSITTAN